MPILQACFLGFSLLLAVLFCWRVRVAYKRMQKNDEACNDKESDDDERIEPRSTAQTQFGFGS